ncbi:MAG: aa3-type cytochrome c oxidase subunit IV [Alphaproteobacteria bacterium]|nr:MAG: aa3-type cytochrome c oxidase subunit IV [Alphaproteobacteria bacterium]
MAFPRRPATISLIHPSLPRGEGRVDIRDKQATYQGFLKASIWLSGLTIAALGLMAFFLL